jgi:hypothetical protein
MSSDDRIISIASPLGTIDADGRPWVVSRQMERKTMRNVLSFFAVTTVFVLWLSPALAATIWHVDCSAPGPGTGTVGNPFNKIQAGLDACRHGDTVEVAGGTCSENIVWPPINAITLRGATGNPAGCIIDGQGLSDVIRLLQFLTPIQLTIADLSIRNGYRGEGAIAGSGIALAAWFGGTISAELNNVIVQDNAEGGIAAFGLEDGNLELTLTQSQVINNRMDQGPLSAGVFFSGNGNLTVMGSTIAGNAVEGILFVAIFATLELKDNAIYGNYGSILGSSERGIGVEIRPDETPTGIDVEIVGNVIYGNCGPASYSCKGISIDSFDGYVPLKGSIQDNILFDHVADEAYGILINGFAGSEPFLIDKNLILNNRGAVSFGGGLFLGGRNTDAAARVTNNIIASNGSHGIQAETSVPGGQITIVNNTVVDNEEVGIEESASGPHWAVIANCIVGDWASGTNADDLLNVTSVHSNIEDGDPGQGNISAEPGFVDPKGPDNLFGTPDDDYHITEGPCQNAGDPDATGRPADDFDGEWRDENPDMGADEIVPCIDNDGDGWGNPGDPSCPRRSAEDCDDANPNVNPETPENCTNGIDDDCDGLTDDLDHGCVPGSCSTTADASALDSGREHAQSGTSRHVCCFLFPASVVLLLRVLRRRKENLS